MSNSLVEPHFRGQMTTTVSLAGLTWLCKLQLILKLFSSTFFPGGSGMSERQLCHVAHGRDCCF